VVTQGHIGVSIILKRCRYDLILPCPVTILVKFWVMFISFLVFQLVKEDVYTCPLHNVLAKGLGLVIGSRSRLGVWWQLATGFPNSCGRKFSKDVTLFRPLMAFSVDSSISS